MAMFYGPPPTPGGGEVNPRQGPPGIGIMPEPPKVEPIDPEPWIEPVIPPEDEVRPAPAEPPNIVIGPAIQPPVISPPPPDITPPTIVPPGFEDPIPIPYPQPPLGIMPVVQPPASIIVVAGLAPVGTFMVYLGKRLLLSMAASVGTQLGTNAGAMLVGPLGKRLARGVRLRYHTGVSPGESEGNANKTAVGYDQAWRMVPQEFSYWEK